VHLARSKLVAAPRRPESVLVVVYTDDGQVLLLQRRSPFEFWQSVTGSLDPGEHHEDTAQRELAEETGLVDRDRLLDRKLSRTFVIDPRWRDRYAKGVTENTEHEWHYRLAGAVDIKLDDSEHTAFRWLPIDEAIDAVWSWTNKEALRALQAELRRGGHAV